MHADWRCELEELPVGRGRLVSPGSRVAVLTIGPIGNDVAEVVASMDGKPAHYDMRFLKPLDGQLLREVAENFERIVTVEDGVRNGGLGSAVTEWLNDNGYQKPVTRLGLPDNFVEHGTVEELREIVGLDKDSIRRSINIQ